MALLALHPGHKPGQRWSRPAFRLGFARLVTHYWHNGA
jgi:proline iminopeptidase